ncbi:MAG: hypothetical protein LBG73_03600 [Spirochaetaceae bacterium]|jgi:hypothetical protein|nr:hypothetical protein [Spirochaetaceae bacterium]
MNYRVALIAVILIMASSCLGVKADITLTGNGSGLISLEYRLSRTAESLGKLDGNERWLTVPIGKADFERTVARVEGLKLRSFSSKTAGQDTVNTVKLEFADPQSLVRFLDASGQRATLTEEGGVNRLSLVLVSGSGRIDADLLTLFQTISEGYTFSLSFTAPREGTLVVYDAPGNLLEEMSAVTVVAKGKTVSFQSPIGDIFAFSDGVRLELVWE